MQVVTPHATLTIDEHRRWVEFRRSTVRLRGDEVAAAFAPIVRALEAIDRRKYVLLVDARDGPLNNDPDFETAMLPIMTAINRDFRRRAVIVRTAAGKLQASRADRTIQRNDGLIAAAIFDDETEARAFLTSS
jgi:hypothetical protein